MPTFVAFDVAEDFCVPVALPSQSIIGEINLLTIMILVRGPSLAVGALERCGDNGFSEIFLPDTASQKRVRTVAPSIGAQYPDPSV